jgi:hypothetical protein|nr:MAG TPA: hypothetical protein [Caudoviricetes sp.]
MLVSEFEKRIKNIDSHLYVGKGYEFTKAFDVYYSKIDKDKFVLSVGENGKLDTFNSGFEYLSNKKKRKLLMACVDMAMTPLDKRVEHKWKVIVGNDSSGLCNIICWKKSEKSDSDFPYLLCLSNSIFSAYDDAIFTDEEFSDLIKYIRTLPDGEYQAKVAEHGKTEVKGELK